MRWVAAVSHSGTAGWGWELVFSVLVSCHPPRPLRLLSAWSSRQDWTQLGVVSCVPTEGGLHFWFLLKSKPILLAFPYRRTRTRVPPAWPSVGLALFHTRSLRRSFLLWSLRSFTVNNNLHFLWFFSLLLLLFYKGFKSSRAFPVCRANLQCWKL